MIFHKKELPKGILFGFSGYVLRDADVYFQIWQKENNIFELVQEYKYKVKKVKPLGVTERQAVSNKIFIDIKNVIVLFFYILRTQYIPT